MTSIEKEIIDAFRDNIKNGKVPSKSRRLVKGILQYLYFLFLNAGKAECTKFLHSLGYDNDDWKAVKYKVYNLIQSQKKRLQ
jgi:hypothetical protein